MRKQILAAAMCPLLAATALAGCGDTSGSDTELAADFVYNGTFDQEVFEHAIRDMKINGHDVSMPCTWTELDKTLEKSFKLDDNPMAFKDPDQVVYGLKFNGERAGAMIFDGKSKELSKREFRKTPISYLSMERPVYADNNLTASIAGVGLWESAEVIETVFGEPTRFSDSGYGYEYYYYKIEENKYISFKTDEDKIVDIRVCCY